MHLQEVTYPVVTPEVAFTGDTAAEVFRSPGFEDGLAAKLLIIEATFLEEDISQEHAKVAASPPFFSGITSVTLACEDVQCACVHHCADLMHELTSTLCGVRWSCIASSIVTMFYRSCWNSVFYGSPHLPGKALFVCCRAADICIFQRLLNEPSCSR